MVIKSAKYVKDATGKNISIFLTLEDKCVGIWADDTASEYGMELKKQVDAGTITIEDAD